MRGVGSVFILLAVLVVLVVLVTVSHALEPILVRTNTSSVEGDLHRPSKGWPDKYLKNDKIVVRVPPSHDTSREDVDQMARDHGFVNDGPVGKIPHYYMWSRTKPWATQGGVSEGNVRRDVGGGGDSVYKLFDRLDSSPHVEWWDYMKPRERIKRTLQNPRTNDNQWISPVDPLFSKQWHLRGSHLDVVDAWRKYDVSGFGVNLAIVDDGLQHEHPDLTPNYRRDLSWDFNDDDSDPEPFRSDGHGTSAAGVAGASEETHCGVGVAPQVNLVGLRLLGAWTTDADEAQALCHKCDEDTKDGTIQVYSNSWGPSDSGERLAGPGHMTKEAFAYCTSNGRQGKGSVYVWAGGNGRYNGDNSNYDAYANSRYTIAIAAVDVNGIYTWYSEAGANILCAAPSSGYQSDAISTTDLLAQWGYSRGGCTDSFGGTSAAAPQIAGVVALMLEARPQLGWRDVQHVLARSSRSTDERNTIWTTNAAGMRHSHDYGFGLVDAEAAVRLSQNWSLLRTNEANTVSTGMLAPTSTNTQSVSGDTKDFRWAVIKGSADATSIQGLEYVMVYVDIDTPRKRRCLDLRLIGPSGVESILHSSESLSANDKDVQWTFSTVRHWGERIYHDPNEDVRDDRDGYLESGEWRLRVRNACINSHYSDRNQGVNHVGDITVYHWKIDFYGK
jgi:hypothetical protein